MMPKFTMTKIVSVLSIALVAIGSGIGQWATMKEWKEETDEKYLLLGIGKGRYKESGTHYQKKIGGGEKIERENISTERQSKNQFGYQQTKGEVEQGNNQERHHFPDDELSCRASFHAGMDLAL